jgi:CHAT domain-containing protein/Tfp pilus assembly protein PilF
MRGALTHYRSPASIVVIAALIAPGMTPRWSTTGQAESGGDVLEPGRPVSGALEAGARRRYELPVRQGDFLRIVVEQDRMDLDVRLAHDVSGSVVSAGNAVQEDDDLVVSAIAAQPGSYRLELAAGARQHGSGRYRATLTTLRDSASGDERRVAADLAYAEAVGLRGRGTGESMRLARDRLTAAMGTWRELGDRRDEGRALLQLTEVIFRLGDVKEALTTSQQAVDLWRAIGDPSRTAAALNDVAVCLNNLGDPAGALERYTEALRLVRRTGNRASEGNLLNNIGRAYSVLGNHQRALDFLEQALPIRTETGDRLGTAITLNNLGLERGTLGEPERARSYHEQALQLYRSENDVRGASNGLNNLGLDYQALREYDRARDYFEQALALDRTTGDIRMEATHLHNIGTTYAQERRWVEARDYFSRSLPLRRKAGDTFGEAVTLGRLGATYVETGDAERALPALSEALRMSESLGDGQSRALALYQLARLDRAAGRLTEALDKAETLVSWFDSARSLVPGPDLRASYVATVRFSYELLIDTLLDLHRAQPAAGFEVRAFEASERARARSMLDSLIESRVDPRTGGDAALVERERTVRAKLAGSIERRIRIAASAAANGSGLAGLDAEIDRLAQDLDAVRTDLRASNPQFAALTQPRSLTLADIRAHLVDDDSVLLEYSLGPSRSVLWIATTTTFATLELPPREALETLARRAYEELSTLGAPRRGAAAALSRALLPLDLAPFANKRLLVVADGVLQYVPFGALSTRAGRPLALSHEIVSLPSASTLAVLRLEAAARQQATGQIVVIADPVFDATDRRVATITKRSRETDETRIPTAADPPASTGSPGGAHPTRFERLVSSRDEAQAIGALADGRNSLIALDFEASRDLALSGRLEPYRVIHFATHGILDSQRPELSGLVLSLVDPRGQRVSGFLQLNDIYNLKLRADLVVLSACQTALGKDVRGEGLIGLTRAFMYAGTPRVIASLWEVPNRATAELMKRFYRHFLVDGMSPAAALRAAQLELRSIPRWSPPFFWAGFVLEGEHR